MFIKLFFYRALGNGEALCERLAVHYRELFARVEQNRLPEANQRETRVYILEYRRHICLSQSVSMASFL